MDPKNHYDSPNAWQTNAFNSQFQNNIPSQEDYASPFGPNPFLGSLFPPPNTMQYNDGNGDSFMRNSDFQSEVSLFNGAAYVQNGNIMPNPQFSSAQFNMQTAAIPAPARPAIDQKARAAELRAELLKRQKGRATSATPPVAGTVATPKQNPRTESPILLRGAAAAPVTASDQHDRELNVNDLISQYSESKPAANASVKQGQNSKNNEAPTAQQNSTISRIAAKSQAPSLGSPTKVTKLNINGKQSSGPTTIQMSRHTSNGSLSEASEGEIVEDQDPAPTPPKLVPASKPKEIQINTKPTKNEETRRPLRDEQAAKFPQARSQIDSPPRRPISINPKTQLLRNHDEFDQLEKGPYHAGQKNSRPQYPDSERQAPTRRGSRDDDYRRPEQNLDLNQPERNRQTREPKPPTLQDLLPLDADLREWLDITGYHNTPYRDKILSRRRAIAALDAQRDKLLAEMAAEERAGLPPIAGQMAASSMLPPPLPNKTEPAAATFEPDRGRLVSNKRPYSDDQVDQQEGPTAGKIVRLDERTPSSRIKDDEDYDSYRPRSRGNENAYRPVDASDDSYGRYDSRARSREREFSPGRYAYEGRPAARTRSYDEPVPERDEFQAREKRPFEVRGAYRGRAYDPHYRGRGRGRGRGRNDSRERDRDFPKEEADSPFSARIANGRPYKDPKGFDRGGKGDTRYFIVKSFSEENVLRCIQDSVWTTQVQNGEIFREAFEACKNVILVFSINKSRAFQGYARMESLPGSVEVLPDWQKQINWEGARSFKVKWLVSCQTRFHRVGHLKNALDENQAVLIGKDGQEIEENCGADLVELIDEEAREQLNNWRDSDSMWDDEV